MKSLTHLSIGGSLFLALSFGGANSALAAATVQVEARTYIDSCGYYSNEQADIQVSLQDSLPWGTEVDLISAWSGETYGRAYEWQDVLDQPVKAAAPYIWSFQFHQIVHERTTDAMITGLDFVWRIKLPNGQVRFERGNDSALGFYRMTLPSQTAPCVNGDGTLPRFQVQPLSSINRQ